MSDFIKSQKAGAYISMLAIIAAIVGLVGMIVCSNIYSAYAYKTIGTMIVLAVSAILLIVVSIVAPVKFGNYNLISTISILCAIVLMMRVVGTMILDRILMIAGLFSYNSQNTTGWQVFYATVVGIVGYILACILLIIASFNKNVK